jgi:hypothetical protein
MDYSEIYRHQFLEVPFRPDLFREKGLGEEAPNERYFLLMSRYKRILEAFLLEKLPLKLIDKNMKESKLDFRPIPEAKQDYYQKSSGMGLDYIYLRNDLHIEKLTLEELRFLEAKSSFDEEAKAFLVSTAERVVNPFDEVRLVFYGPQNGRFLCDSNAIVIGIRYDEFESDLDDSAFTEAFLQKQKLISQLQTIVEVVGADVYRNGVRFLQYNEASVLL